MSYKLCIVTDTLPPVINGINTILINFAKEAHRRGWKVLVIGPKQAINQDIDFVDHLYLIPTFPFPLYPEYRLALPVFRFIKNILSTENVNHVHFLTPLSLSIQVRIITGLFNYSSSGSFITDFVNLSKYHLYSLPIAKLFGWNYVRWFYNGLASTFCPSKDLINYIQTMGVKNCIFRPSGVNNEDFSPLKRSAKLRKTFSSSGYYKFFCLYVGRISPEKNLRYLIKVANSCNEVKFLIVGDGPDRKNLENIISSNVEFLGPLTGDKLQEVYASCDIFLFPSFIEAGAGAPLEAMASGLPVFAFKSPGLMDILEDGNNGYFISDHSPSECAKLLLNTVQNKYSLERLSQAAQKTAASLLWERSFDTQFEVMSHFL